MRIIAFIFSFLLFFGFAAQAAPVLFNITPVNNSYTYGKDTDIFSTKIIESGLNVSTVYLHIRVEDPTSIWSNISMSSTCVNTSASDWRCNATVTGLSALAGDGNTMLYFFDAYDNSGTYGSNGTADGPNRAKIDRRGPTINFTNPANQSYTSGNSVTIRLSVVDELSGINLSSVNYSFDNSSWYSTSQSSNIFSSLQGWDTTTYTNNQTVAIYAKAVDLLGNANYKYINVTIDNEVPRLRITLPTSNQTLYGTVVFSFTAEDTYAGLDNSTAAFTFAGSNTSLACTGTDYILNCSKNFITSSVADSPYNLTYSIKDKAGNLAQNNTSIIIDNNPPTLSITSPSNNAEVNGVVSLTASATDAGVGVSNVSFRWENSSTTGNWSLLSCSGNVRSVSCSGSWNSTDYSDGIYTIRFSANDSLSRQTISGVTVRVNSTAQPSAGSSTTGSSTTDNTSSGTSGGGTTSTTLIGSPLTTTTISKSASGNNTITQIVNEVLEEWQIIVKKNWIPIVIVITIAVAIALVYLLWPKKTPVYPGYKPKKSFKQPF